MAKLTLSLGSNEGNREEYLRRARAELSERLGSIVYTSAVVSTAPWGPVVQNDYLNQVLMLRVDCRVTGNGLAKDLHAILDTAQDIERRSGRVRELRWGPRTLDIDLIFLDDVVYEDDRVSLPHPWWHHRSFVRDLLPPGFVDPYGLVHNAR